MERGRGIYTIPDYSISYHSIAYSTGQQILCAACYKMYINTVFTKSNDNK